MLLRRQSWAYMEPEQPETEPDDAAAEAQREALATAGRMYAVGQRLI